LSGTLHAVKQDYHYDDGFTPHSVWRYDVAANTWTPAQDHASDCPRGLAVALTWPTTEADVLLTRLIRYAPAADGGGGGGGGGANQDQDNEEERRGEEGRKVKRRRRSRKPQLGQLPLGPLGLIGAFLGAQPAVIRRAMQAENAQTPKQLSGGQGDGERCLLYC
jgi:hypothetical protein